MQVTDEMNARFRSAVNDIQNVYSKSKAMAIDSMISTYIIYQRKNDKLLALLRLSNKISDVVDFSRR